MILVRVRIAWQKPGTTVMLSRIHTIPWVLAQSASMALVRDSMVMLDD
jgi:hypothetical protein